MDPVLALEGAGEMMPLDFGTSVLRVLLVEDDQVDALLIRRTLAAAREEGFAIQHVQTLAQAFRILDSTRVDIVLVDLSLPDSEGLATIERLLERAGETPIVALTSVDDGDLALKTVQLGAQDYVVKSATTTAGIVRTCRHARARHRRVVALDQARKRAYYDATHDALTGLPNRRLLSDRLACALAYAERYSHGLALLSVDLDRFKTVNDSLGHPTGDLVLAAVADRLRAGVRRSDTVARVGGDEFLLILSHVTHRADVMSVASTLVQSVGEPVGELRVTASVGVALFPADGESMTGLIEGADAAMYEAKKAGGNRFALRPSAPR
jgi:diguanylate cyclase (GGDEF)-like protein